MSRLLFLLIISLLFSSSCREECNSDLDLNVDQDQLAADIELIDDYIAENDIDVEIHPSGLRYTITREGTGSSPKLCDNITAAFGGKLISNGFEFSPNRGQILSLGSLDNLVPGWQIGLPLIKEGGRIILYIPSVYGYGSAGRPNGGIPPNANLEFEILLF